MSGKRCSGCGEVKAVGSFSRQRRSKDGLQSRCKACKSRYYEENREAEMGRNRRWREENREAIAEYARRYYEENREAKIEYQRRYREGHREAIAEKDRRYREGHREAIAEKDRRYREENREAIAEYQRRYREENREAIAESKRRYYEEHSEAIAEYKRRRSGAMRDMTLEVATRKGERYTPAEDAHILASDEPYAAIAVELGRTMESVKARRAWLHKAVSA